MNIAQTRQLLSFLWSKFPNSRALSVEDKQMTVLAYFDELWQYSLQDALDAARKALKEQPHFVPSAPEISHHATKTFDPEPFLSKEYFAVKGELEVLEQKIKAQEPAYDAAFKARIELTSCFVNVMKTKEQRDEEVRLTTEIDNFLNLKDEFWKLKRKLDSLSQDALCDAADAYNKTECALATNDFKQLGWIERRTAIEQQRN